MRVKYTFLFVLAITYTSALAQDVTEQEIKNNYVIASDNMEFENYDQAIPALHWLLKNAPTFSESIQSYAIKAFEAKANEIKDVGQKSRLLDSMLIAYESKREHYGLSEADKNRLAFKYYKHFRSNPEKTEAAFQAFSEAFQSPETVISNNIVPYIYMAKQYNDVVESVPTQQANQIYDQIKTVVDLKKATNAKRMDKYMSMVDNYYVRLLGEDISCETMTRLAEGLNRSDSVRVSKRLMSLTLEAKCGRTETYQQALTVLARNEPTSGLFKILAQYDAADGNFEKAIANYKEALKLETDNVKKASIHFDIAQLHSINLNKPEARKNALTSIALNPEQSAKGYSLIGKLYMDSFNECSLGNNPVEDRAVFFAAYDMFEKANDEAGMESAMAQFPTKSLAFDYDLYANDSIEVACWINVKTKVRTRSSN